MRNRRILWTAPALTAPSVTPRREPVLALNVALRISYKEWLSVVCQYLQPIYRCSSGRERP